jgi:hypothetical protein
MFGDGIGGQQPQDALASRLVLRLFGLCAAARRLVLCVGRAESTGDQDRRGKRKT